MSRDADATCRRALGFLELGMPEDALAELDELEIGSSLALHLRVDALFRLHDWQAAREICLPMTEQEPSDAGWWIQAAYATRRAFPQAENGSLAEAESLLRAGLRRHPEHPLMLYNLACYSCIQQRLDEARGLLQRALAADEPEVLKRALADPDLLALRPWLLALQVSDRG